MDLFMPPKQTLAKILECSEKFTYIYHTFPKNLQEKYLEKLIGSSSLGIGNFVGEFYNLGLEPLHKFNCEQFFQIFIEGIMNAIAHGPSNKKFANYGLFLGDKGICQGFNDGGNYFKSEKIKNLWENKLYVKSTKRSHLSGFGIGNQIIHDDTDSIDVDTTTGTLYCIQSHKTLGINPGKFYKKV